MEPVVLENLVVVSELEVQRLLTLFLKSTGNKSIWNYIPIKCITNQLNY